MKSKKLLSLILIGGMIFSNTLTVSADTTISEVVETNKLDEIPEEAQTVNVTYISAESLSITIPKTMTLDGTQTNPQTSFNIKVEGDISGTSEVNIRSDEYFYLKQDGKEDVKAVVGYNRTFSSQEVINNTIDMGSVNITTENGNKLSSGEWTGNFKFYINYNGTGTGTGTENPETPKVPELVIKEAGLYASNGSFIPWDSLNIDIDTNYSSSEWYADDTPKPNYYKTSPKSGYNAFDGKVDRLIPDIYLVLPEGITSIGENAFYGLSCIESIHYPSTITNLSRNAFSSKYIEKITYNGTMEQWNNLNKTNGWNGYSLLKTVICSDGTITL